LSFLGRLPPVEFYIHQGLAGLVRQPLLKSLVVSFFGAAILKPDREYRLADTVIGMLLGAFVGGVIGIALWFQNLNASTVSPLFMIGASVVTGGIISGALAFLLGKRFTDALESLIAFFRRTP
jgi:hypothetical protein